MVWSPTGDGGRDSAFYGRWSPQKNMTVAGEFVVQCKHTSGDGSPLTMSLLDDEFAKVTDLVKDRGIDAYLLLTNHRVTGVLERRIVNELNARGVKHVLVLGVHWISQQVYESARLRALVPRVYGLGDLGEILDARCYEQARAVLASLEDELRTFVPVEAYRRAVTALERHRFVCLIGEPGSGKSTIAAILTLLAADQWTLNPIRAHSPAVFEQNWNPNRSDQVFWADDAFGSTQYESVRSLGWRRLAPDLRAAVRSGARFVLTTRDYIFKRAVNDFRVGDLPVADLSQIVIHVEELTPAEKEEILYNHIKLGAQPKSFRAAIKPHLPSVADRAHVLPEVAKRLASPFFTAGLKIDAQSLSAFADDPSRYLLEVLKGLAPSHRAALILLLTKGGLLQSPVAFDASDIDVLEAASTSAAEVREALHAMRGTLLRYEERRAASYWTYRHPTIHDAISAYVAEDPELVAAYLRGARTKRLLDEVYFAGSAQPQGASIAVPRHLYEALAQRLITVDAAPILSDELLSFLAYRADDDFLRVFAKEQPDVERRLLGFCSFVELSRELSILEQLRKLGVLSETTRRAAITRLKELATDVPDPGWVDSELLDDADRAAIMAHISEELQDDFRYIADHWSDNYDRDEDPHSYLEPLDSCIKRYIEVFAEIDDADAVAALRRIERDIDSTRDRLYQDYREPASTTPSGLAFLSRDSGSPSRSEPSRFDDLDE